MNKNILVFIISIIVVVGIIAMFTFSSEQTTQIDTKFLSGTVQGMVVEDNSSKYLSDWKVTYNDTENGVYYDFMMADSFDFIEEAIVNMMGAEKVDTKEYNSVRWEIYYLNPSHIPMEYQIMSPGFTTKSGYFCFASGKNGDYLISVSSGGVHSNSSTDTDLFKGYIEPLLNNMTLKDPSNPPKEYKFLNSTKGDYDMINSYVKQNGWEALKDNLYYNYLMG